MSTIQLALEVEPENIKEAMKQWRVLSDHISEVEATVSDHVAKVKELKKYIQSALSIAEGELKSETLSIPGVGTAYKKSVIAAQVNDWEMWQKYLTRHSMSTVLRHQNNIAPLQDLHEMIMKGELPMPQSIEFTTYDKLSIRRI